MKKQKKKMKNLDKYVVFCFSNIIIFTITAVVVQVTTGMELSSTLITCFYGLFGGELLALARIKILKLKKGEDGYGICSEQLGTYADSSSYNSRAD